MSKLPQSFRVRVNRTPVSAEFLPTAEDRDGRLGFGWTREAQPYASFDRSTFAPQGTHFGPPYGDDKVTEPHRNSDGADGGGNFGPYRGTNFGPYGSYAKQVGLGYQPDLPDLRDYQLEPKSKAKQAQLKTAIADMIVTIQHGNMLATQGTEKEKGRDGKKAKSPAQQRSEIAPSYLLHQIDKLPSRCDLRATGHLSPVEDQGPIGSCTAQAVVGLIEYLMRAGGGDGHDMSRLFVYKMSRRLLGWEGDTGAYLRTAIKSVALFGLPPEEEWPYDVARYNEEPLAYHFAFAQNFKATTYARLDGYGDGKATLDSVKRCLQDGFPVVFGFPVYSSIDAVGLQGRYVIPNPNHLDALRGGHAVLAVGYDDNLETSLPGAAKRTRGALLIRNSWGVDWGVAGYAYLPYEYVYGLLAVDFWTVFNKDWIKLEVFV